MSTIDPDHEINNYPIFTQVYVPFKVGEEIYQTCCWFAGDLKSTTATPLVIVHGGAGLDCEYLVPHVDLVEKYNIPIVLYDQIGGGFSTHLPHKGSDFWTVELMCDQLEQLLAHLGISERYDYLGHSWGGTLGAHFIGNRQPRGLRRFVVVGSPASHPLGDQSVMSWVAKFPERCRIAIEKAQKGEEYNKEDMQEGEKLFRAKHGCQVVPTPPSLVRTFARMGKDPTVNDCLMGTVPFLTRGKLEKFSVIDVLHKITAATLVINGEFDMCQDFCVKHFFYLIPNSKWVHFDKTSHASYFEDRERYMRIVYEFLKGLE